MSQDMGSLDFSAAMSALKDDSVVTPKGKSDSEIQMSQSTVMKRESITRVSSAPLDHDMRKSEQPKEKEAPKEAVKAPPPPSPPPVADKPANVGDSVMGFCEADNNPCGCWQLVEKGELHAEVCAE